MLPFRTSLLAACAFCVVSVAVPAHAQDIRAQDSTEAALPAPTTTSAPITPMSEDEVSALPAEYQSLPTEIETSTTTGVDGVETITRTRRIVASAPPAALPAQAVPPPAAVSPYAQYTYYQAGYAPTYAPLVLDREQWIAECQRRTEGRDDTEKGNIIGGLLGAIGGGILGNELAAAGEALGGTLIGAGVGGIAGVLIGGLIAGDGDEETYDCEGALNAYLDQANRYGSARYASRTIPTYPAYPAYGYAYPQQAVAYPAPQTVALIPVTTYQQQRVVVRETVREETVPGAARTIAPPPPAPAPQPVPSPKMIKN